MINTWSTQYIENAVKEALVKRKIKVWLDAGHGGHDGGAYGSVSKESANVLKVALLLRALLQSYGYIVGMSRADDRFIELGTRAIMANNWGADIFISLHNNSAASSAAHGFETFVYNGGVSNNTLNLQKCLHGEIIKHINIADRGMKQANFAVLRMSYMPAVLIEYGFINNKVEEKMLMNEIAMQAQLTANGVNRYFNVATTSAVTSVKPATPKEENNTTKVMGYNMTDTARVALRELILEAAKKGIFNANVHTKEKVAKYTDEQLFNYGLTFMARNGVAKMNEK